MVPVARFGGTPWWLRLIRPMFVQFVHPQLTAGKKGIGIEASYRENAILDPALPPCEHARGSADTFGAEQGRRGSDYRQTCPSAARRPEFRQFDSARKGRTGAAFRHAFLGPTRM